MYCKNCGKQLSDEAFMCPECGTPTNSDSKRHNITAKLNGENSRIFSSILGFILSLLGTVFITPFCVDAMVYAARADEAFLWGDYYQTMAGTIAPIQIVFGMLGALIALLSFIFSIHGYIQSKQRVKVEYRLSICGIIFASLELALLFIFYLVATIIVIS